MYVLPYPRFFSQHAGVGGHVAHAAGLISGLIENGYDVDVVAEETHPIFASNHCHVDTFPAGRIDPFARQLWGAQLLRYLRSKIRIQEPKFCYIRYSASFSPWIPGLKRALGQIPLILEVNSAGSQWTSLMRYLDRRALRSADRIVCISDVLRRQLEDTLGSPSHPDMRVVMNGVDTSRFPNRPPPSREGYPVQVGYAGLLKPGYGLETIVEAGKLLDPSRVTLNIYGDGPFLDQIRELSSDVPTVVVHGAIPFLEMPEHLLDQDILLYVTGPKYTYQSPTKLFEYFAAGRPIVCAATPQTRELVDGKGCAELFPVADAEGLATALRSMISDPERRLEMGGRARALVVADHSWASRVEAILRPP
ncbi:MAG: glycosyltransferase family 4 protein [Gammaproteobacteria bacterium]|nr:glycosyltransferase family 4 protein [Gammaproteobacteria bacterium]